MNPNRRKLPAHWRRAGGVASIQLLLLQEFSDVGHFFCFRPEICTHMRFPCSPKNAFGSCLSGFQSKSNPIVLHRSKIPATNGYPGLYAFFEFPNTHFGPFVALLTNNLP